MVHEVLFISYTYLIPALELSLDITMSDDKLSDEKLSRIILNYHRVVSISYAHINNEDILQCIMLGSEGCPYYDLARIK